MKALVVTASRIFKTENGCFIDNGLAVTIQRYKKYFGEITLFGMDGSDKGDPPSNTTTVEDINMQIMGTRNELLLGKAYSLLNDSIPKYDLIILRIPSSVCDQAARIAKKHNVKYLVEVIGDAFGSLWYHSLKAKPFAIGLYINSKKTVYNADFATYVSNVYLQKRYPCKNKSVGVSDCVIPAPNQQIISDRLERVKTHDYKTITIMNAAAIDVSYKGQEYIIKAIPYLNKKGICVKLNLVGRGSSSYLSSLAERLEIQDQVSFVGVIPHEKVLKMMELTDFYIQPSLTEAISRSIVEAKSKGCICIGTNIGGIPELISEKYLVKPKNECDIAEKILYFINLKVKEKIDDVNSSFVQSCDYEESVLDKKRDDYFKYVLNIINKQEKI